MSIERSQNLTSKHYRKRKLKNSDPLFLSNYNSNYNYNSIRQTVQTEPSDTSISFFKKSKVVHLSQHHHVETFRDRSGIKIKEKERQKERERQNSKIHQIHEKFKSICPSFQTYNINQSKYSKLVKQNRELVMDNVKIEKQNIFLLKTIQTLQNQLQEAKLSEKQVENYTNKFDNSQIILTSTIELVEKISKLQTEIVKNEAIINKQTEETNQLNYLINDLKQEINRMKEIALMQREEYLSQMYENQMLRNMIKKCRETNKKLYNNVKTSRNNHGQKPRTTQFGYEQIIYHTVVNKGSNKLTEKLKKMPKVGEEETINVYPFYYPLEQRLDLISNLQAVYQNKNGIKEEIIYQQQPTKPSFFSFISQQYQSKGYGQDFKPSSSAGLLPSIRCILDSYFNLIISHHDHLENVPDFPEFVYDYNTQFWYDKQKLKMKTKIQNSTVSNCQFYAQLMMEEFNNNWEVVAFRQFLFQKLNFECLFFYLQVRNHLLRNQISTHISSHFETYFYVRLDHTEQTLRLFLSSIDKRLINTAYKSLKVSSTLVNNNSCVEAGFASRIFLQFFKANRQKQLKGIVSKIKQMSGGKLKPTLNLLEFCKLIQHKYKISYLKTIRMYRRCFSLADGNITPESVLAVILQKRLNCTWIIKKNSEFLYVTEMHSFISKFNLACIQDSTSNTYADDLGIQNPSFIQGSLPDEFKLISHFRNVLDLCMLYLKKQVLKNTLQISNFSKTFYIIVNGLLDATLRQHYKEIKGKEIRMSRVVTKIQKKFRKDMGTFFDQLNKVTQWNNIKAQQ